MRIGPKVPKRGEIVNEMRKTALSPAAGCEGRLGGPGNFWAWIR
jgi:hypothetical protein